MGVNNKNKEGDTALHLAAQGGHGAFVELLIDGKCNVELMNAEGKSASDVAEDYEHIEVAHTIENVLSERALDSLMNELGVADDAPKKKKKPKFKPVRDHDDQSKKGKGKKGKNNKKNNKSNKDEEEESFTPSAGGGGGGLVISENQAPSTGGGLVISDVQPVRSTRPPPKAKVVEESESEEEDDEVDLCDLDDDLD